MTRKFTLEETIAFQARADEIRDELSRIEDLITDDEFDDSLDYKHNLHQLVDKLLKPIST